MKVITFSDTQVFIFCCNFHSTVKLKFWVYNEKNMDFHFTPQQVLLWIETCEIRMYWEHPTVTILKIVD